MPSIMTMPLTSPAVAVSTFRPDGVAAGAEGSDEVFELLPPPHAATEAASARPRAPTQMFRRRIDVSSHEKDQKYNTRSTFNHTLRAGTRLLRRGRGCFAQ